MTEQRFIEISNLVAGGSSEVRACTSDAERKMYQRLKKKKLAGIGVEQQGKNIIVSIPQNIMADRERMTEPPTPEEAEVKVWEALMEGIAKRDNCCIQQVCSFLKLTMPKYQVKASDVFTPEDYVKLWKQMHSKKE
jgi:hypothetical protein